MKREAKARQGLESSAEEKRTGYLKDSIVVLWDGGRQILEKEKRHRIIERKREMLLEVDRG